MRLAPVLGRIVPPEVTQEVQAWLVLVGLIGIVVAPFLSTGIGVKVINVISMVTLVTAGLAGLDATRPNAGESEA